MRLYDGTIQEFKRDVLNNEIADIIAKNFLEKFKKRSMNLSTDHGKFPLGF